MLRIPAAAAAALVLLLLGGCSGDDDPDAASDTASDSSSESSSESGSDAGSDSGSGSGTTFSAAGVTFETPEGWEELAASDVADGAEGNEQFDEVARDMGLAPDDLRAAMETVELFVFRQDTGGSEFVDNVNVVVVPGEMPNDRQIEQQFAQLGADVGSVDHASTGVGEVTLVEYELPVADYQVAGTAVVVDLGDGPVTITVSCADRATTDEVVDLVLDTLTADS